ncbi:MAG: protein translocase subunit SecD [Planctomycetaceae bacterium]|nr:protein translocase subunit SecD [Planctomycetaceae bacterium]
MSVGGKLLFIFGIIASAFILGWLISSALKMQKEISGRLTGVLLALFICGSPFLYLLSQGRPLSEALRPGIDLAGGTNMVFQVYTEEGSDKQITNEVMDQMVAAVIRRINPSGTEEVTVRKVGADRIEVIIPGVDRELVEEKKELISRLGSLEFGILANTRDHADLAKAAQAMRPDEDFYREDGEVVAVWRDPGDKRDKNGNIIGFKQISRGGQPVTREVTRYGKTYDQFLVLRNPDEEERITGENLSGVQPSRDQNGNPAVSFRLDGRGSSNMSNLTSDNLPSQDGFERRLAILLDDMIHQAPSIKQQLSSDIQISGLDRQKEVKELVDILNAGALKVPIKPDPISEFSISPLLGADVRAKGLFSIKVAGVVVFGFMLIFYMRCGVIADLGLLLNMILVIGAMSIFSATFTLPGLAGLVLTIGMAVDANVLIFERIREEKERKASPRMAIQNGFDKAFSTIIDANVTTLITAVILYFIGSDQVKGFAVALFIGIVMSVFSALIFGRLLFDIGERKKLLGEMKMMSIVGRTHINFLAGRKYAVIVSILAIGGGMAVFAQRGTDNLDIDFTGGTMVTFELVEPAPIEEVRDILEEKFGNITLERLTLAGEQGDVGRRYRMRTNLRDAEREEGDEERPTIQQLVGQAFEGKEYEPRKVTMEIGEMKEITPPETEGEAEAPEVPFQGGHSVEVSFSEEISPATIQLYFGNELAALKDTEGIPKYELPGELFEVKGTGGSGLEAAESEVKTYDQAEIEVDPTVPLEDLKQAVSSMQEHMASNPLFDEVNSFDSSVASDMRNDAIKAIFISLLAIVFYIWIRFDKVTFGLAAVAALVHDVLVVLGMVAIASNLSSTPIGAALGFLDFKINLPMVAAFLTIVGYSLNDTIVVFDRIREVRGKNPAMTTSMVNLSLNQTLSRTLLTSLTTFIVVVILYCFGGEGIHGFAFCLVLGVIVGTYSSIYVASPVLLWLINRPGSEIGMATAKAEAEEQEKQQAAAASA